MNEPGEENLRGGTRATCLLDFSAKVPKRQSAKLFRALRAYARAWGFDVVRGGYKYLLDFDAHRERNEDLAQRGVHVSPVVLPCGGRPYACAIDVVRRRILWPAKAKNPYVFLHELTHLVFGAALGAPPTEHHEEGLFAAIELASVLYLERPLLRESGWLRWRRSTSEDDGPDFARVTRRYFDELLSRGLFREDASRLVPTFELPNQEKTA